MPKLKVSVVIPVYNEVEAIIPCLNALFAQTVPADEIIVVDNASTDGTRTLLKEFGKRIRVLDEPRSGVVFARTTGFDAATGDVIGRIDADSRVTPSWVAQLHHIFADPEVVAVTGRMHYYDMPRSLWWVDNFATSLSGARKKSSIFLHGSNMAIRREAWQAVRGSLCLRRGIHEDLDLAVHLRLSHQKIRFAPQLLASISARRLDDSSRSLYHYAMGNLRTYQVHGVARKRGTMIVAVGLILFHLPLRMIHRGYNSQTKRLSLKKMLFARPTPRKSPLN